MNRGPAGDDEEARFARLLAVVRHELMSPLTVIHGFARLLGNEDEDREEFAAIRRNASIAMLLLDRLRDADHIIEGHPIELDRVETDLARLVEETMTDVRDTLLSEHEVYLERPEGPVLAEVDESRIRQVLFNLLSNAAKYSEPGTTVILHVRRHDDRVEIAVTNEGEGIAPEDVEVAFQAFSRLSDEAPGTGLGLAISRSIARAHGGDLTTERAPDAKGSVFVLSIPTD